MSLYGFDIPHDKGTPCRDIIGIQLPYPPRKVGSIITPDIWRELSQHGLQAGIIRQMGPMAFTYKDGGVDADGKPTLNKQPAAIGDWVLIKWGAGTLFQAGRGISVSGGWRYVSTYGDVIKVIPAADMPSPDTLTWDEVDDNNERMFQQSAAPQDTFAEGLRERTVYNSALGGTAGIIRE